ncbi:MAG TPA: EscU/YscU/HrcU family type III secretion system export apparatus switch protein [Bryobacteraceae bacterium]|nr:EscU/YscU/HrcU family type III secretion system export apparatus switch protein [Bryobacteraceae bacterium]
MADKSGKTEEPTQHRLQKSRKEGQYASAKDFVAGLQFLVFLGIVAVGGSRWFAQLRSTIRWLLSQAFTGELHPEDLSQVAWKVCWQLALPLALGGLAVAFATLGIRLLTTRFGLSLKKLAPDLKRLNPASKLRELPRQNLPAMFQAMIMLPIFLWAAYVIAREKLESFLALPLQSVESGCRLIAGSMMELFWKAGSVFLVMGAVDLFRQMRRHKQDLRMSKQEIKEEMKEMEGNPQMKAKIRRLQRDRARKQMMKEVPTATAVIVNPTHFAVAIRYQMESMAAPLVVAKGKNYLALRIRQKAIEHQVPIIENPPLAQALYKAVDVGQEIPPHLYRAVAEILAYIFKLMNGRLPS